MGKGEGSGTVRLVTASKGTGKVTEGPSTVAYIAQTIFPVSVRVLECCQSRVILLDYGYLFLVYHRLFSICIYRQLEHESITGRGYIGPRPTQLDGYAIEGL
jgi:hypothetical protein